MKNHENFKEEMSRRDSKIKIIRPKQKNKLRHGTRSNKSTLQYLNEEE